MSATRRLPLPKPYDVPWTRWYLKAHTVPGLEAYDEGRYARTLTLTSGPALLSLQLDAGAVEVAVESAVSGGTAPDVAEAVSVARRLLDLDADGAAVDARLAQDPALTPSVAAAPGLRVPGAADGWELLVRTMVGQQISLAAARTHLGRLVAALGEPLPGGWRIFPTAGAVATGGLGVLGGPRRRVAAVVAAAETVAAGRLDLSPERDPAALRADLMALPGVGPWTADYVVMRLTPHRDVLLDGDLVVRQGARLLGLTAQDLADPGRWSPVRSYATMHLWRVALAARTAGEGARSSR
ncbi:MAG: AlkA N-terminal domain-containing protein [Lapillicoccus sp.]